MSPKIKTIIVSILALLVYSCSKEIKPEEIEPHDICYLCKMAISQLNFATEIITPDGEVVSVGV